MGLTVLADHHHAGRQRIRFRRPQHPVSCPLQPGPATATGLSTLPASQAFALQAPVELARQNQLIGKPVLADSCLAGPFLNDLSLAERSHAYTALVGEVFVASTESAGAMTGRQGDGIVEKEQRRPNAGRIERVVPVPIRGEADDPE